ncbi:MAG: transporter [Verrucomicrobiales bacterium VVV1]|nr:MAG: transporter [Verrucomicrobiales bacterium VVV1]
MPGQTGSKAPDVLSAKLVILSVLPAYLLILAGAALRRVGVLRRDHDEGVMHVVFHVLYPCLILDKILGSEAVRSFSSVGWSVLLGFFLPISGIACGWLVGKLIGLENGTGRRTFALSAGVQNFGYTAIPVVQQLWGIGALSVLFVHNLGVELAMWSVGVMLMSGGSRIEWRKLINGPVFAVVGGLLLVALGVDQYLTPPKVGATGLQTYLIAPMREAMKMLGSGAFPMAIVLTGAMMWDLMGKERPSAKILLGGSLVRFVISPAIILAAAKFLPIPLELKQVLVVQAAMPAAMTPILFARIYGGRPGIAVQIVVATTVISLLTLPWIISWGTAWVGLKP